MDPRNLLASYRRRETAQAQPLRTSYDSRSFCSPDDLLVWPMSRGYARGLYGLPEVLGRNRGRRLHEILVLSEMVSISFLLSSSLAFAGADASRHEIYSISTSTPHKVPYCSADCQKQDWISGNHKKWCGQALTDLALPPAGWSTPPSTPPLSIRLQRHLYDRDVRESPQLYGSLRAPLLYVFLNNEAAIRSSLSAREEFRKGTLTQVLGISPFDILIPLLFKALDSRDEQAIAHFVSWLIFYTIDIPDLSDDPAIQLAADWDVGIGEMREWVDQGLRWKEEEAARTVHDLRGDFETLGMLGED